MPGLDPIGRKLRRNSLPLLTWEVVGIVADASDVTAEEQACQLEACRLPAGAAC
jgi:hypothetical protein